MLLALAPLHVRFSHLAATDAPSVLWSSLAVLWAVRATQRTSSRDLIISGVFCGLSGATKYPGLLAGASILAATWVAFPGRRLGVLLPAAATALLTFACATPYVWLDGSTALTDLTVMTREHALGDLHSAVASGPLHLVGHNLRLGLGAGTCLAVTASLLWRPGRMTPAERVVLAALAVFALFAASASSAFMRYAMPMAPLAVVLALRRPKTLPRPLAAIAVLAMLSEPGYSAVHLHRLLTTEDTRIEARRAIEAGLPEGGRVVHFSSRHGRPHLLSPDFLYRRQRRAEQSFGLSGVAALYERLAERDDLPPLYVLYTPNVKALLGAARQGTIAAACRLKHPLSRAEQGRAVDLSVVDWYHEIGAGEVEAAAYDPVDLMFLPLDSFGAIHRSGPNVTLGSVPLKLTDPIPSAATYFGLLAELARATVRFRANDWAAADTHYETILATPFRLQELLSYNDLAGLYYGSGVASYATGDTPTAIHRWTEGVRQCPDESLMRFNLSAALLEAGDPSRAARQSVALLRQEPDHDDAWHNLTLSLRQLGRMADAQAASDHDPACLKAGGRLSVWLEDGAGDVAKEL